MRREDYRAVKRMSREQLTAYLQRIYRRGYDAGTKASLKQAKNDVEPRTTSPKE